MQSRLSITHNLSKRMSTTQPVQTYDACMTDSEIKSLCTISYTRKVIMSDNALSELHTIYGELN